MPLWHFAISTQFCLQGCADNYHTWHSSFCALMRPIRVASTFTKKLESGEREREASMDFLLGAIFQRLNFNWDLFFPRDSLTLLNSWCKISALTGKGYVVIQCCSKAHKEDIFGLNNSTTRSTINTEMRRRHGRNATAPLRLPRCHLRAFLLWRSRKRPFVHLFPPLSLFARFN